MFIPIIKKTMKNNEVLVERALPKKGELVATPGERVEPFAKLGMAKVSYGVLPLKSSLKISKGKEVGDYFYTGDTIGKVGGKRVVAPFDGTLIKKKSGNFSLNQEDRDFWLLAGVWGEVISVVEKSSALIKTQTLDIHLAACTNFSYSGELIVFPNPTELLEMQYLQKFSKDPFGKVIYTGDYISLNIAKKAVQLGVTGLIAGSADREAFIFAKQNNLFVGAISGFGHIPTPDFIYSILNGVTNRYIFLQGDKGVLRIPVPEKFNTKETRTSSYTGQLRKVKKGLLVQVFDTPYFGWVGRVSAVKGEDIYVMLDEVSEPVKVKVPNILALE